MERCLKIFGYLLLVIGAFIMIAPFVWLIFVSFMTDGQIFSFPPTIIPKPFITTNYEDVLSKLPITKFFLNSLFVALLTTVFQVFFSAMAGYSFARCKFRGRDFLFFVFLLTMMVPPQVNIIPLFFVMRELNWIDTYQSLILPGVFGGFGVFLMRQWFLNLPCDVEDAAKIDGCGLWGTFFKIAMPLSVPVIVTLGLFTFITSWNSFMWPLIVTNSIDITTLPVAISQFKGSFRETILWGDLMACSVILLLPVVVLFLLGKKYFINDILSGSIKS
jgi:ABC-type glycerol-3-phosphate transport system permease component